MATRMWTPAASALRRRLAPGMAPPARPRFVDTFHSQAGHQSTGIRKSAAVDESLSGELYKVGMTLREREVELDNIHAEMKSEVELDNIHAEMKSVTKRFVIAIVGLPLLAWVLKTY